MAGGGFRSFNIINNDLLYFNHYLPGSENDALAWDIPSRSIITLNMQTCKLPQILRRNTRQTTA